MSETCPVSQGRGEGYTVRTDESEGLTIRRWDDNPSVCSADSSPYTGEPKGSGYWGTKNTFAPLKMRDKGEKPLWYHSRCLCFPQTPRWVSITETNPAKPTGAHPAPVGFAAPR